MALAAPRRTSDRNGTAVMVRLSQRWTILRTGPTPISRACGDVATVPAVLAVLGASIMAPGAPAGFQERHPASPRDARLARCSAERRAVGAAAQQRRAAPARAGRRRHPRE